jgi:CYTH domain-containing protein
VGWLPREELVALSRDVRRPLYEIEGLISFYPHFKTSPPAKVELAVCHDLTCWLHDSDQRITELKARYGDDVEIDIHEVSCLGRCDVAPAAALDEHPIPMADAERLVEDARGGRHPDDEEAAGLAALQQELVAARAERYRQLEERWLSGGAAEFCAEVREMSRRVATAGQPNREIERKYLLKRMPRFSGLSVEVREIDQGWLPGERLAERLRRVRVDGKVTYYRTVKLGAGISRFELEEETDERTFRRLWSLTKGKRVRKLRYRVQDGAFTWEIDRFRGRRLVLAEVELPSEDTEVEPPVWLRRLVVRDVTGEPEYVNINLAS